MITPLLRTALEPIAEQHRRLRLMHWLSLWWVGVALLGAALLLLKAGTWLSLGLLLAAAGAGAWFVRARGAAWEPDWPGVARRVEERHPELHALLLTAVEQSPDPRTRQLNYLQQRVIAEAVRLSRLHNWLDAVPQSRAAAAMALQIAAFAAMLGVVILTFRQHVAVPSPTLASGAKESAAVAHDGVEITPGDAELERGSGLVVLATFRRDTAPSEATLVVQPQNQPARRMPLAKNLNDPAFGGGLPEVDSDMTYRVEYAGRATRDFKVKVFEHPRLDRADATLRYPSYTKLPEKTLPDTHRVSAVEGTKLDVAFQLNKPVKSAALVSKDGKQEVPLAVEAGKPAASLRDFAVQTSQAYELRLVDAEGRTSKTPAQFAIEALPNRRPELKFLAPKGDQRVSPIEEVAFRAQAWDDFGLVRYGIALNVAGQGEKEIELGRDSRADERREMAHLLKLEDAGVKPDELLSWYLWAEDIGPDGKPRRTATDMFFGEVRPFEEIYRQGDAAQAEEQQRQQQQQQGGQQGGGDQATKLADLQKQIITATWNLKRGEDARPKSPSEQYLKDALAVRDGQSDALQQASALGERAADDPKSRALVENVTREMQSALDKLNAAAQTPGPLPDALAAEQQAYNALLKLASHEFNVTRQRQNQRGQQAQGGQQDRQRQQLDQLDLKEDRQRYETNRQAAAQPQNEQQRNQLATLNRLKELSQRQQDINERLKELQTALQSAKTEQEKEEAKRQLKRLREEEQQMLADMDETRQQMERSPDQGQTAEDRRRLEDTRNEAQQAAQAMERGAASQALASGARAQQQLQDMRDDLRKKTSGQFNDDMRQMRQDARELAQNQEGIAERLKGNANPGSQPQRRSLEENSEREQIAQQLKKQQDQLADLAEQMKRVSEQSEVAEPLLSKELYDTLRKNAQAGTDQKLQRTQLLAERGYSAQAQEFEQKAREEIEDLKSGVERAAESVLGNEADALRQARSELDALNEQLDREIAQARPDLAANNRPRRGGQPPQPGQPPSPGQDQTGEQNGGPEAGQDQAGNPQTGDARSPMRRPNAQGQDARNQLAQGQGNRRAGRQSGQQNPTGQQPGEPTETQGQNDAQAQNDASGQPSAQDGQNSQQPGLPGRQRGGRGQLARQNTPQDGSAQQPSESGQPAQGQENQDGEPGQGGDRPQIAQNAQSGDGANPRNGGARQQQPRGGRGQLGQQGDQPGQQNSDQQPGDEQGQAAAQNGQRQGGGNRARNGGNGANGGNPSEDQNAANNPNAANDDRTANRANDNNPNGEDAATPEDAQRRARAAQLLDANSPNRRQAQQRNGGARAGGANNANGGAYNGGPDNGGSYNGGTNYDRPLTGEQFVQWSDRLRNVEEMLDAPDLRNEVTRVREYARGVRVDFKRGAQPDWDAVRNKISQPLAELRNRLTEELARRESKENLVPIDRDPVPNKYAEGVRRYYEELGLSR